MGPGILLLGLPITDLSDQLIVADLKVARTEYLRDDQGPSGLGVDDTAAVKLLEKCGHELFIQYYFQYPNQYIRYLVEIYYSLKKTDLEHPEVEVGIS